MGGAETVEGGSGHFEQGFGVGVGIGVAGLVATSQESASGVGVGSAASTPTHKTFIIICRNPTFKTHKVESKR